MKNFILLLFFLVAMASQVAAQEIENPVHWSFEAEAEGEGIYLLSIIADIEPGWYLYSQHLDEGGPIPTRVELYPSRQFELLGEVEEEGKKEEGMDPLFGMHIAKFKEQAYFRQRVRITDGLEEITGYVEFMTCDEEKCLPPTEKEFTFSFRE